MKVHDSLLSTDAVTKRFGGLVAVDDVSFDLARGKIVGVVGPNGAGKTTLFDLLTGFLRPDQGRIFFEGREISTLKSHERAELGIVRTFQITRELTGMSVFDNMLLGGGNPQGEHILPALANTESVRTAESKNRAAAEAWLKFLELWELRDEFAGNLSGGQRKLLELGRAIMTEPSLLLLDEPLAGVNPVLTNEILALIEQLRMEAGVTFLMIEHDMEAVMDVSDEVIGMVNGKIVIAGQPETVRQDATFREAFMGGG